MMDNAGNALAAALAKAQGEMKNAGLNKVNPHFKSKYADLPTIRDAVTGVLSKHGLAIAQFTRCGEHGTVLVTRLMHADGGVIDGEFPLPNLSDQPQKMGSAITYARRYSLAAMCGIAAEEDDDAEAATDRGNGSLKPATAHRPATTTPKAQPVQHPATAPAAASGKPIEFDPHAPKAAMSGKPAADAMQAFCGAFSAQVRAARTSTELEELWAINDPILTRVQEKNARAFDTVTEAFNARQAEVPGPLAGG